MTTSPTAPSPPTPPPARKRRRFALVAGVAVGLALAAALAWWLLSRDSGPSPGPLTTPEMTEITLRRHPGQQFGFGLAVAYNNGEKPAVLRSLGLIDPTPGLRVVGTRVAGPERELLALGSTSEWPSDEFTDQRPVRGFAVAPISEPDGERGVELLLGLRADKLGRYETSGVVVDYTVGDTEHRAYIRNGLSVCVIPASERIEDESCPFSDEVASPTAKDG